MAYLLGDMVAWDSMKSNAAVKNALFQDLIHLAREKAERFQVPVEWGAQWNPHGYTTWIPGKVRATEEVLHVLDSCNMNRYGQWGPIHHNGAVIVKKKGLFFKERVFRVSWSDKPPRPGLNRILEHAATLLAPAT